MPLRDQGARVDRNGTAEKGIGCSADGPEDYRESLSRSAVKVSATPMAPKATGSAMPAEKPGQQAVYGEPRRPRPGQVPKTVPEPYPKGSRGETKFGPPQPNQQRQQPSTKVEPCWHFVRNHGWCPWRERCWFGYVKKSKAKKRREARARQRARARNAASSSTPQASAPQTADTGNVPGGR